MVFPSNKSQMSFFSLSLGKVSFKEITIKYARFSPDWEQSDFCAGMSWQFPRQFPCADVLREVAKNGASRVSLSCVAFYFSPMVCLFFRGYLFWSSGSQKETNDCLGVPSKNLVIRKLDSMLGRARTHLNDSTGSGGFRNGSCWGYHHGLL